MYNPHPISDAQKVPDELVDRFKSAIRESGIEAGSVHEWRLVSMFLDVYARGQGLERARASQARRATGVDEWYGNLNHAERARVDALRQQQLEIDSREPKSGRS